MPEEVSVGLALAPFPYAFYANMYQLIDTPDIGASAFYPMRAARSNRLHHFAGCAAHAPDHRNLIDVIFGVGRGEGAELG